MGKHKVMLVVVLLVGTVAGLVWHLGDYAPEIPQEGSHGPPGELMMIHAGAAEAEERSREMAQEHGESSNHFDAETAPDLLADRRMIGVSFELSKSVQANCRMWGDCSDMRAFLERMAAEPRNDEWARAMESRIEKAVMSGERGKFRIRALECRRDRCALEVASEVDNIGPYFDSDPGFNEIMIARPGYFGHESDPQTGIETLVSAQIWQTMESFSAEEMADEQHAP